MDLSKANGHEPQADNPPATSIEELQRMTREIEALERSIQRKKTTPRGSRRQAEPRLLEDKTIAAARAAFAQSIPGLYSNATAEVKPKLEALFGRADFSKESGLDRSMPAQPNVSTLSVWNYDDDASNMMAVDPVPGATILETFNSRLSTFQIASASHADHPAPIELAEFKSIINERKHLLEQKNSKKRSLSAAFGINPVLHAVSKQPTVPSGASMPDMSSKFDTADVALLLQNQGPEAKRRKLGESLVSDARTSGMFEDYFGNYIEANLAPVALSPDSTAPAGTAWQSDQKSHLAWQAIVRNQIPQACRDRTNVIIAGKTQCKNAGEAFKQKLKQKLAVALLTAREGPNRGKAYARFLNGYVKKNERDWKRKADKEAETIKKKEDDIAEKKRQEQKLNFLLTQTELYSHFMAKKMGIDSTSIAPSGDVEMDRARQAALDAVSRQRDHLAVFDAKLAGGAEAASSTRRTGGIITNTATLVSASKGGDGAIQQPRKLKGTLKAYQLKGLTWLVNLYNQGINGILADEMGLGKTVQTISFLSYLAEEYNVWGPFLVIAPTSTLPNWANEVQKFAPHFHVIPYWGNAKQRKTQRKLFDQNYLGRPDSPFHVLVTSYKLVVLDQAYFNRLKWQYMILDEAHAIKNASSVRWNALLGFGSCRNRLLLTGTPIQNNMAELWALLHFIMPTLFDSHNEFYEWFSKDIESHSKDENQGGGLNEHQLSRLHMILKPFMLRRVKKEVENEMPPKTEVEIKCDMTPRQERLYKLVKNKVSIVDLLNSRTEKNVNALMNIIMHLRKICNHPDIMDKSEPYMPLQFAQEERPAPIEYGAVVSSPNNSPIEFSIPRLIYQEALRNVFAQLTENNPTETRSQWLQQRLSIWKPSNVFRSMFPDVKSTKGKKIPGEAPRLVESAWSFTRFLALGAGELNWLHLRGGLLQQWIWQHTINRKLTAVGRLVDASALSVPLEDRLVFPTRHLLLTPQLSAPCAQARLASSSNTAGLVQSEAMQRFVDNLTVLRFAWLDPKVQAPVVRFVCSNRSFMNQLRDLMNGAWQKRLLLGFSGGKSLPDDLLTTPSTVPFPTLTNTFWDLTLQPPPPLLLPLWSVFGYSHIKLPTFTALIEECGKLKLLDSLLFRLKNQGHRVLVYSQMTMVLDMLEDFLGGRRHKYVRLDGSSRLDDRRDMVDAFQKDPSIFVFLLSTRAGGLGINLTAADTVIFYDSDWNPTMDAQAMDRAHRLGQTRPVTVYRLVTRNTVEEKILHRAKQKDKIHLMVIGSGEKIATQAAGGTTPGEETDVFQASEVMELLMDDQDTESISATKPKKVHKPKPALIIPKKRSTKPVTETAATTTTSSVDTSTLFGAAESIESAPPENPPATTTN